MTTKTPTKKKKTSKKQVKKYTATAKIMGRNFTGEGETIEEAIGNIEPGAVAGMVILTVEQDGKKKERVLPNIAAKRLFMTVGMTRDISLKTTSSVFNGL